MKARRLMIVTAGLLLAIPETRWEAAFPKAAPARLRQQAILKGQDKLRPSSLAFSPDGKILATLEGEKGTVRLWNVADGKSIAVLHHRRASWRSAEKKTSAAPASAEISERPTPSTVSRTV